MHFQAWTQSFSKRWKGRANKFERAILREEALPDRIVNLCDRALSTGECDLSGACVCAIRDLWGPQPGELAILQMEWKRGWTRDRNRVFLKQLSMSVVIRSWIKFEIWWESAVAFIWKWIMCQFLGCNCGIELNGMPRTWMILPSQALLLRQWPNIGTVEVVGVRTFYNEVFLTEMGGKWYMLICVGSRGSLYFQVCSANHLTIATLLINLSLSRLCFVCIRCSQQVAHLTRSLSIICSFCIDHFYLER